MSLLLFYQSAAPAAPTLTLDFIDINGNPLPAGVRVDIYAGSTVSGTAVLSKYLGFGASLDAQQTLTAGSVYTCSFFGTQAPTSTVTFTASAAPATQTLTCPNYISPDPTQAGYAALQTSLWPRGWFSDSAMTSGGVAYNLAYALGWANALIDQQVQETTAAMRLQSSTSNTIDSWAYDFFGNNLPRNSGESDASYIGRIEAMLTAKQSTPAGVAAVAGFFGTAWVNEPWRTAETGGCDTATVAADSVGGVGTQNAGILVFVEPNPGVNTVTLKTTVMASRPVGMSATISSVAVSHGGYGIARYGASRYGESNTTMTGTVL